MKIGEILPIYMKYTHILDEHASDWVLERELGKVGRQNLFWVFCRNMK